MDHFTLIGLSIALGMDAFAVSAGGAAALEQFTSRHTFRLAWHFGLFQALMTVIGWAFGAGVSTFMWGMNHWIAAGLLFFLGVRMIRESLRDSDESRELDPTRGWSLVALSVATSLDALAVGVTFSLIGLSVWGPALLIGVVALIMAFVGTRVGRRAGNLLGAWAERAGGVVLILIGVRILANHLSG